MVDWSDDRIAALSDQDLKNLLVNAERKSVASVIEQCKAEIEKRDALKPRKASKPRTEVKEFEHEVSGQLAAVGKQMAEKYDLSEETAKASARPAAACMPAERSTVAWRRLPIGSSIPGSGSGSVSGKFYRGAT